MRSEYASSPSTYTQERHETASASTTCSSGRTDAGSPGATNSRRARRSATSRTSVHRRLLDVEALREVRDRGRDHQHDRELPGAALAPREPARRARPEPSPNASTSVRARRDARRQDAADEVDAVGHLRRQRRDDRDQAGDGWRPGEQSGGRRATHAPR